MIPVFVCTGFLDSGKTTLVKETLMEQEWIEDGLTLLITCEEGEETYSQEYLKKKNMVMLQVEEVSQLNTGFFKNCERHYRPTQVIIEYNGMWNLEELLNLQYPRKWEIQGVYSTVDGSTLDMYLKNMRNLLMQQLQASALIVVNRCPKGLDRAGFRRAVKIQNPMAQLIFEGMDGEIIPPSAEDLPYDVKGEKIVISDEDFGIWYVDVNDHPEYYQGKEIEFAAQVLCPKGMREDMFVPARKIMACCEDDVDFYGYPCKLDGQLCPQEGEWIQVRVRLEMERPFGYPDAYPVLYLIDMRPGKVPDKEVVYLG